MLTKIRKYRSIYELNSRWYSVKQEEKDSVKYTNTINLPKTKFPQRLSQSKRFEIERSLVEGCFKVLYEYQELHNAEPKFVLHDGPPYANGALHMGHAVNKILKDITLRRHLANHRKVHFIPGWDCHGLPIELKAMSGKMDVDPLKVRERSLRFALQTLQEQKQEFESWGIVACWSNSDNIYRTLDAGYIDSQLRLFLEFYKNGLVYRDLKPVYWSPSSRTALAEAELEYDPNFQSPSVLVRFKIRNIPQKNDIGSNTEKMFALVWTTTPWTLPSNQAICYNPKIEYSLVRLGENDKNLYLIASDLINSFEATTQIQTEIVTQLSGEELKGTTYLHPIEEIELPFLSADHVQESKGTGLVHTAPAHGPEDFLVSLNYKIPIKCIVNEEGKYTEEAPSFLTSKSVLTEGDNLVLNYLKNDIIHSGIISHSYPIDWRTKQPVIIRASEQWFINTDNLKHKAIEEVNKIDIYPKIHSESHKKLLVSQIQKRPYWCISRQRSWGVPIPVFYAKSSKKIITNEKVIDHICSLLKTEGNMNFWWSKDIKELLPVDLLNEIELKEGEIEKGKDIFDIWFDSGISWNIALKDEKVADLYLEGSDQFTGWFQSSLLTSVASRNIAPYKSLFVHGFTVDEKGYKMSKSLGNIISPKDIIKKYGVDTLRWWVGSHATQHSPIIVSNNLLQGSAEIVSKIRGILRYLNGVVGEKLDKAHQIEITKESYLDKYILNELYHFAEEAENLYNSYEYNRVTALVQNFTANQLSSNYLHLIKDRLYCGTFDEFNNTRNVLQQCYYILCKIIWPIIPFLVEESWSYYDREPFHKTHVKVLSEWNNPQIEPVFEAVSKVRSVLKQKIKDVNTWTLKCEIQCNEELLHILKNIHYKVGEELNSTELCEILQVSSICLVPSINNLELDLTVNYIDGNLCPRCRRHAVGIKDTVCHRCDAVLLCRGLR